MSTFLVLLLFGGVQCLDISKLQTYLELYKIPNIPEAAVGFLFLQNLANISEWDDVSLICKEDLLYTVNIIYETGNQLIGSNLTNTTFSSVQQKYMMPLVDSWAKLPPGVLRGNIRVPGQYVQCTNIHYYSHLLGRQLDGEYYRIFFNTNVNSYLNVKNLCFLTFAMDICLPKSCENQDLSSVVRAASNETDVCQVRGVNSKVLKANAGTWIVGLIMASLTAFALIASFIDYYIPEEKAVLVFNPVGFKVIQAFSAHRNISEIFTVTRINKQTGCLNCLRVLSMAWVVVGHVAAFILLFSNNPLDQLDYFKKDLLSNVFTNAYPAVDSFFFMSGYVLGLTFFKGFMRNKKMIGSPMTWIMFYVHRFLRLTPPYYFMVFAYTFVIPIFYRNMPVLLVPEINPDPYCRWNYWTNLMYINNFVKYNEMCLPVSWYLSVDLQMYLFSPILLVVFAIFGALFGVILTLALCTLAAGLALFFTYHWNIPPCMLTPGWNYTRDTTDNFQLWVYDQPLVRLQPYVVGIAVGYFVLQKRSLRLPKIVSLMLWILSLGGLAGLTLSSYAWNSKYLTGTSISLTTSAFYNAFSRLGWAFCLAWIVVACYYEQAGPIGDFLNWWIWIPLSRLSYAAYLTQIPVLYFSIGMNTAQTQFSSGWQLMIRTIFPIMVNVFVFSIYWTAVFEKPFVKLEALLLGRSQLDKPIQQSQEVNQTDNSHLNTEEKCKL